VTKPGGADKGVQDAQKMLNTFFQGHVIAEDGKIGPHTIDALKQFQAAQKLPVTGLIDDRTHDFLVQISTPLPVSQTKVGEDLLPKYSHLIEHADRSQPDWWGGVRELASYWLLPPPISYARQMAQAHALEDVHTHTGYRTGAPLGDWKAETAPLGKAAQDVLSHAISEGDPKTLRALSKALSAAGFPSAASAMGGRGGVTPLSPPPPQTHDLGPGF
jgi:peptidoglycan hydrolase-like protein with peptidoglycan-binding domain